ncbi:MAG: GntR family transcriptional regulator [Anaerolineae bacterium]
MEGIREDRRPLAMQLRDRLRLVLQEGQYRAGERLPSEEQLSRHYGVSRATVREALRSLEEERLIICRHGAGRFVAPDPSRILNDEITNFKSTAAMFRGFGISPRTRVLDLRKEPASPAVIEHLGLQPGRTMVVLERVWLANDEPIIYSVDHFDRSLLPGELTADRLGPSLIDALERNWGICLTYTKSTISAVQLAPELRARLGVLVQVPWLLMEQVSYDTRDRPILFSYDYHRGDRIHFRVLRRRR